MLTILVFAAAAILSFAQSLVLAATLGPEAFGRYAIGLSGATLVTLLGFEWIRLATIRFLPREGGGPVDATLHGVALRIGGTIAAAALLAPLLDGTLLVSASLAAGLAGGAYEIAAARARVSGSPARYAVVVLGRGVASLAASALAALVLKDAAAVLGAGAAASACATVPLLVRSRLAAPVSPAGRETDLRRLIAYAMPLVAAAALFGAIPFAGRTFLGLRGDLVAAGIFGLAGEIAARLFQNLGAALDTSLFRAAVEAGARAGQREGEAKAAANLAIVVAVLAPAAAGLVAVWPPFVATFLPARFGSELDPVARIVVPSVALLAAAQFGLAPLFQLQGRTLAVSLAAATGLATNLVLLLLLAEADPVLVAGAQAAAYGVAGLVLAGWALRLRVRLPWRDVMVAVLCATVMAACLWPWRSTSAMPGLHLATMVAAGATLYAALAWASDLAGCRRAFLNGRTGRGALR